MRRKDELIAPDLVLIVTRSMSRFVEVALFDIDRYIGGFCEWRCGQKNCDLNGRTIPYPAAVSPTSPTFLSLLILTRIYARFAFSALYYSSWPGRPVRSSLFVSPPGIAHNTRSLILALHCDFLKASRNVPENCSLAKYRRYLGGYEKMLFIFLLSSVSPTRITASCKLQRLKAIFRRVEIHVTIVLWKLFNVSVIVIVNLSFFLYF